MITWKIESLECLPLSEGHTNVITNIHWRCIGTEGEYSKDAYGSTKVEYNSKNSFTEFNSLTEEQVLEWVWASGVDKYEIEGNINHHLAQLANPPLVKPSLPWAA
jgi:hypothetical protein